MRGMEIDLLGHITWRKVKNKKVRRHAILAAIHSFINLEFL